MTVKIFFDVCEIFSLVPFTGSFIFFTFTIIFVQCEWTLRHNFAVFKYQRKHIHICTSRFSSAGHSRPQSTYLVHWLYYLLSTWHSNITNVTKRKVQFQTTLMAFWLCRWCHSLVVASISSCAMISDGLENAIDGFFSRANATGSDWLLHCRGYFQILYTSVIWRYKTTFKL